MAEFGVLAWSSPTVSALLSVADCVLCFGNDDPRPHVSMLIVGKVGTANDYRIRLSSSAAIPKLRLV
jgi:hypothetical protein